MITICLNSNNTECWMLLQMASALANRAMGAIVGSAVADAAGNNIKCLSYSSVVLYLI